VLIKAGQANILIDPIFSNHAGPVPGMVKAFKGTMHYDVSDMPAIDIVMISHDHYDHMDYRTLMKLKNIAKMFVVPMGVASHLRYWGFDPARITELNWHQSIALPGDINITATPAQHRSNRTFDEESKTLWASYVIKTGKYKLFFSGDGGYGPHFKNIGQQYGPFNLALLECGQYSINWPYSHMMPAETARAAADLRTQLLQPIHWAKFAESDHKWQEPLQLLLPAAQKLKILVNAPRIGEPYMLGEPALTKVWWDFE
jgi:L-ascorbate metabolism protein UlaG (beta-lactamase superfamily)